VAFHTSTQLLDPDKTTVVYVGIPEIDAEHRQLISHYNALIQALDEGDDVTAFGLSFYSLVFHVREHFSNEEWLMQSLGYPAIDRHKAEHQKLLATADDFLRSVLTRFEKYDCSAVAKYFKYWLFDHVMHHDRALAEFVVASAPCTRARPTMQEAVEIA
jgi:hemerythrin